MMMQAPILVGPNAAIHCLTDIESALLLVLDDEFVSASVIKWRAKLPNTQRITPTRTACTKLEELGLAEGAGVGLGRRWRRAF